MCCSWDPMTEGLEETRQAAARRSRGTSSDPIYELVLRLLREHALSGHVLDFGAGTGSLSLALCELGTFDQVVAVDLIDYPDRAGHSLLSWHTVDLETGTPFEADSFDVVVAVEVIEHLENPRAAVRELARILRPGGSLLLTTPNNESWRSAISYLSRGYFTAFGEASYPAHISPLLRVDLRRIVCEAGFDEPAFHFTGSGRLPRLTHFTWQQLSRGVLGGMRYSDNVACLARKAS